MKINNISIDSSEFMDFALPLKLLPVRAWRTYLGGKLIDKLHGTPDTEDGHFPEEWIASIVSARNSGREKCLNEGLSICADSGKLLKDLINGFPEEILGKQHVVKRGIQTGVLVKLIDSVERLTIQVHPDKMKAQKLFDSPFGKTECWHIINGRKVNCESPCIYLGFKPGISKSKWKVYFNEQNIDGMLDSLHRIKVKPGDTFLVEGGVPHAIGAGCFLVEIQEPTDYSIRTERKTPSGFNISDFMCHQGLGFSQMMNCFNYEGLSRKEVIKRWCIKPELIAETSAYSENILIGYTKSPCFKMSILNIFSTAKFYSNKRFSVLYVLSGDGTISSGENEQAVTCGDQFFIPASIDVFNIASQGSKPLNVIRCWGPEIK